MCQNLEFKLHISFFSRKKMISNKEVTKIITFCAVKLIKHKYIITIRNIDFPYIVSLIIDNYKDNFIDSLKLFNNNDTTKIENKSVILISLYANEE